MDEPAYIELNFRPNVALVSVVRRFVLEFYQRVLGDPDGTSRVALSTHELLENAVKYSSDGETMVRIEVYRRQPPTQVHIRMRNRASAQHIEAIKAILEGVQASGDAFAFYQKLMVENAKRKDSGLGLARVCAEGEMKLTHEVAGDQVVMVATTSVAERSAG